MPKIHSPSKREGLSLAQVASYDDMITDALVDRVSYWTTIRKNRSRYSACRGFRDEDITDIIRQVVVVEKDSAKASTQLLELPGFKKFFNALQSPDDKEHFQRHLRKYVNIYLPDCPFEVNTTNRYTIDTQEAATTARRCIKKGELVKYLSGIQVAITREEEKTLDLTRRDFSIVMSSRKRTPSLFLGPARFANHDCDANARLTTKGSNGMTVVAAKDIDVGEEITVTYGDDYFGVGNCECLCGTCEKMNRNGWAPKILESDDQESAELEAHSPESANLAVAIATAPLPEEDATVKYLSKKRQHDPASVDDLDSPTPKHPRLESIKRTAKVHKPSKLKQQWKPEDAELDVVPNQAHSSSSGSESPPSATSEAGSDLLRCASTPPTSLSESSVPGRTDDMMPHKSRTKDTRPPPESPAQYLSTDKGSSGSAFESGVESGSDLLNYQSESHFENGRSVQPQRSTRKSRTMRRSRHDSEHRERSQSSIASDTDMQLDPKSRKPGDYTLTPRLLCAPYSRWVRCHVCSADFVQPDAYQTRWSCPRCERHSKLYGYIWPKTDKTGKNDTEERILDHRTINRFVWADEERSTNKGSKRALMRLLETRNEESQESSDVEERTTHVRTRRRFRREEVNLSETTARNKRKRAREESPEPEPEPKQGTGIWRPLKRIRPWLGISDTIKSTGDSSIPKLSTSSHAETRTSAIRRIPGLGIRKVVNGKRPYVRSGMYVGRAERQRVKRVAKRRTIKVNANSKRATRRVRRPQSEEEDSEGDSNEVPPALRVTPLAQRHSARSSKTQRLAESLNVLRPLTRAPRKAGGTKREEDSGAAATKTKRKYIRSGKFIGKFGRQMLRAAAAATATGKERSGKSRSRSRRES